MFLLCLFLQAIFIEIKSDMYISVADLEELLPTEFVLSKILENHIVTEEKKLEYLKKFAETFKTHYSKASDDVESYLSNPLNAYISIRKLVVDWSEVEALIRTDLSHDFIKQASHIKKAMKFPTDEDLKGAAAALIRLQETYRLDVSSLAKGIINGVDYKTELSASDCIELGKEAFLQEDYDRSLAWMEEATSRLVEKEKIRRVIILEYSFFSAYKLGNLPLAISFTKQVLEIVPRHEMALANKEFFEELQIAEENRKEEEKDKALLKSYEAMCRGDISPSTDETSKLSCHYMTNNHFLLLAPFKVEEAHHNPDILIFHDVLSDDEIAAIKQQARSRFGRSEVGADQGQIYSSHRISKTAWLRNQEDEHISVLSQRVSDMSGLDMETAEPLQIVNYGIGGHYEPHYDCITKRNKPFDQSVGNRIATVLFYMSDVEQGGATVFANLGVVVWPKKGSAVFWHNLHESGDSDVRTVHAACPVLVGSKWVCNKWIHERGQEFLRPCTPERPPEDLVV